MAQGFSAEVTGVLDGTKNPTSKTDGRVVNAKTRLFQATFDLSLANVKGASGDTDVCFVIPAGYKPCLGWTIGSATMGATATIAIGNATTAGKYRAAAIHTAVDSPQLFMISAAAAAAPLAADETVIITIAAAALPGTGIFSVFMLAAAR